MDSSNAHRQMRAEKGTCLADLGEDGALQDLHAYGCSAGKHPVGTEHVGARGRVPCVAGGRALGIAGVVPYHLAAHTHQYLSHSLSHEVKASVQLAQASRRVCWSRATDKYSHTYCWRALHTRTSVPWQDLKISVTLSGRQKNKTAHLRIEAGAEGAGLAGQGQQAASGSGNVNLQCPAAERHNLIRGCGIVR